MGPPTLPSRHHVGAALVGAIVIGAGLTPAAALADDGDPDVAGCPDPVSVISWNDAEDAGDPHAVAVTAQLLDADTEGWSSASRQAAADTTLTTVTAIRVDGGLATLPAEPTGTASDIAALAFCGTTQTTVPPPDSVDHGSAGDPPPAPVTVASCEDLLSVATPERMEGDPLAVVITAQALDLGAPGWSNVGWEPAAGTRLRAVFVTGTAGTVSDAGQGTSATDVASLHFCGTVERSTAEALATSPSRVTPVTPNGPATPAGPHTPGAPTTPEAPAGDVADAIDPEPGGTAPDGTEHDVAGRNAPDARGSTDTAPDHTAPDHTAPDHTASDDTAPDDTTNHETEEVEVLGIQLTREDEPSGSGPSGTGVVLFAVLALLATAGGVLWSRHS